MVALALVAIILTGVAFIFYYLDKWYHSYWKRKGVVQLQPKFLYGNLGAFINVETSKADLFRSFYLIFRKQRLRYGGVYGFYKPTFVPIDPDLIKRIIQVDFDYFTAHFLHMKSINIVSIGLFELYGQEWKQMRRKLTPTFTSGKMKMMFEILEKKAAVFGHVVAALADKPEAVEMKNVFSRFTTDVIGSTAFGIECNSLENPNSEFRKKGDILFTPKKKPGINGIINGILGRLNVKGIEELQKFFINLVRDTINYREKNNIYKKDFLHLMIQLKNKGYTSDDGELFRTGDQVHSDSLTEFEIAAQSLLFFSAGFETSATTMTHMLYELSIHQDIQDKIRSEAREILKKYGGKFTYEALMDLKYTECAIQETLRLHPPVAVLPRSCTKNYIIPGTDIVIEKGTPVEIPVYGLHLDPEYFPNPEKFDPERFSDENKHNIKEFTYLPFGEGPRMCLGLRFAMMQVKMGIASMLKDFQFTLNSKTQTPLHIQTGSFITGIQGGLWLNISKAK